MQRRHIRRSEPIFQKRKLLADKQESRHLSVRTHQSQGNFTAITWVLANFR
jgi:hypothetical protein